ncbi:uncharacterized protein LOC111359493 [Spodoptera litura]|uniref:Uncharacterized protein LOC111359493 n=1 Tax=Spodoptera litura TaxID=69820 RepID=A0A9J7EHK0_SPOLT|nr:uncharacterized protein LOC111359493 [Spodoptera litura]
MPRSHRSPKVSSPRNCSGMQAHSDSEITAPVFTSPAGGVNITSRSKRPCPEFSPGNELQDFKREILELLSTWKREQEDRLNKFSQDQNSCLAKLVSEITELKLQNLAIQKSNNEIEKSISFINDRYDDMIRNVDILQKESQKQRDNVINLDIKVQDIKQLSRSSCVEIRNVPAAENETTTDLNTIINKVGTVVGMALSNSEIRDTYRLPGKPGTVRPIIAEFTSVHTKNYLIKRVRDFNKTHPNEAKLNTKSMGLPGDSHPVFVAEYLPASSRKLFFETRQFAKENGYRFCWSVNGNIYLRKFEGAKQVLIRSRETLRNLKLDIDH